MTGNAVKQSAVANGACLCGAVRFAIDLPVLWCAHCHCTLCRRAHGAGFVTWCGVADAKFRYIAGGERVRSYASSEGALRSFCPTCGSSFVFKSDRWPGETHVALGCLLDPIDRGPERNVWSRQCPSWSALPETDEADPPDGGMEYT